MKRFNIACGPGWMTEDADDGEFVYASEAEAEVKSLRHQLAVKDALIERMPAWVTAHAVWLRTMPGDNGKEIREAESIARRLTQMISGE